MSALPAEVHAALSQLLPALQSSDNPTRSQAEDQLNNEWLAKQPQFLLIGLAEQSKASQSAQVCSTPRLPDDNPRTKVADEHL